MNRSKPHKVRPELLAEAGRSILDKASAGYYFEMGEVIKFGSGRNNSEREREGEADFTQKITEITGFLMNLRNSDPRSYNPENIAERRKAIQSWSNDDLRQEIMLGNELKWKEKPSWYHAVLSELASRVNKKPNE